MAKGIKTSIKKSAEKNRENNYFIWAFVLVVLLIVMAVSLTYAYFSRNVSQVGDDPTTTITTGKLDVDFLTSEYIINTDAQLVDDEEAYILADRSSFSVSRSKDNTVDKVYYTLKLVDIDITDNLKSSYLKWRLYDTADVTSSTEPINYGDFSNFENNSIELHATKIALPNDVTHNFVLIIWLSNDETKNQTELLKGSLSVKVEVTAVNVED